MHTFWTPVLTFNGSSGTSGTHNNGSHGPIIITQHYQHEWTIDAHNGLCTNNQQCIVYTVCACELAHSGRRNSLLFTNAAPQAVIIPHNG